MPELIIVYTLAQGVVEIVHLNREQDKKAQSRQG
jgi:hypothetical protein